MKQSFIVLNVESFERFPAQSLEEAKKIAVVIPDHAFYRWIEDDACWILVDKENGKVVVFEQPDVIPIDPVQIPASGVMLCRRGFLKYRRQIPCSPEWQKSCDGTITEKCHDPDRPFLTCDRCGLLHAFIVIDGVRKYGPVL